MPDGRARVVTCPILASLNLGKSSWATAICSALQVQKEGHCLRVEVERAEGLPALDMRGGSDGYVVLTAQSEAGLQMFKTRTIPGTLVRPCRYL